MKKSIGQALVMFFIFTMPFSSMAITRNNNPTPTAEQTEQVKTILLRLDEIKAMDKSTLNASEKRALRQEVRSSSRELKRVERGGIYLSAGAVIIIVLLLVLCCSCPGLDLF